jgi:hypothetical protein
MEVLDIISSGLKEQGIEVKKEDKTIAVYINGFCHRCTFLKNNWDGSVKRIEDRLTDAGVSPLIIQGVIASMSSNYPKLMDGSSSSSSTETATTAAATTIPQRGEPGYLVGQEIEALKQQDPEFARFEQLTEECAGAIVRARFGTPEPGDPSTSLCMQEVQRGLQTWCGPVGTPNYHQVKCEQVHGAQEAFDLMLR